MYGFTTALRMGWKGRLMEHISLPSNDSLAASSGAARESFDIYFIMLRGIKRIG